MLVSNCGRDSNAWFSLGAIMLIGDILTKSAKNFPKKLAVICGEETITYSNLERSSNRLARALIRENLGKSHNVGIYSSNQIEYHVQFSTS